MDDTRPLFKEKAGVWAKTLRAAASDEAAVVTDDHVRASVIADGSERDAIVSRHARPGSVCIGTPRAWPPASCPA